MNLSILIPTYNTVCVELAKVLQRQAEDLTQRRNDFNYEVIVADDGSTDRSAIERNKEIDALPRCRYVIREKNVGRAAIRNFLARAAQYEWLLFIDGDMVMLHGDYLSRYANIADKADVVYGGYTVRGDDKKLKGNLRFIYERKYSGNDNASERNKHPYNDFHTSNFIVRRSLMLAHPLDERLRRYGYEDVLFGRTLRENGVKITHIDNQLSFEKFESNADFISKTEEGLLTLCSFKAELLGYSNILRLATHIEKLRLLPLISLTYRTFGQPIKKRLIDNKPSLLLFYIYRIIFLCGALQNDRKLAQRTL